MQRYDAIVLAGGAGRRLGGVDKAALQVGAGSLLDRALAAVGLADRVVVVGQGRAAGAGHAEGIGPGHASPADLIEVCEHPPGGGPVAALAAGLGAVESELVVVLACDMPFVTPDIVELLVRAADRPREYPHATSPAAGRDGAMLVDADGRRQFLAAAYRTRSLRRELRRLGSTTNTAMRQLVRGLTVTEVTTDPEVTLDCDTWADVRHSRDLLEG